mmetsp:Transcript_23777/g.39862  ORF Transcript_23777/g.39862 Transcript_23777/m.39862 type:complete len:215 (+) Transcript_23777:192-836(+)
MSGSRLINGGRPIDRTLLVALCIRHHLDGVEELVAVPDRLHNFLRVPDGEHFQWLILREVVVVVVVAHDKHVCQRPPELHDAVLESGGGIRQEIGLVRYRERLLLPFGHRRVHVRAAHVLEVDLHPVGHEIEGPPGGVAREVEAVAGGVVRRVELHRVLQCGRLGGLGEGLGEEGDVHPGGRLVRAHVRNRGSRGGPKRVNRGLEGVSRGWGGP